MGYMAHHTVLIYIHGHMLNPEYVASQQPNYPKMPDIEAFRQSMPENYRPLFIGPIQGVVNGDYTLALLPDGSKEGWENSDTGDSIRSQLIDLFTSDEACYSDGSSPFQVVEVRWGGDEPELAHAANLTRESDEDTP